MTASSNSIKRYGVPLRWLRPEDIIQAVEDGHLIINPLDKSMARENGGFDVKVGKLLFYEENANTVDHKPVVEEEFQSVDLRPGQSALFQGLEFISFPEDMMAMITLRARYSMKLIWPFGMGLVRLKWKGHLVFEVANVSSHEVVTIRRGDAIASLDVFQLDL